MIWNSDVHTQMILLFVFEITLYYKILDSFVFCLNKVINLMIETLKNSL